MKTVTSKDDPGRRGQIIGGPRSRSDGNVFHVRWNDNATSWAPEYSLIIESEKQEDAFSLLRKGRFGRVNDLRRNLTFVQLSGRLANIVYSMDTTNTEFLPYQYKPVLTFLESPSNGILIADEVGLGKTIEAGLIWTELRARYDARRLLIVCPAMLRDKWSLELDSKFGVDAVQLSAAELEQELQRNKHDTPEGKGFICSLQGIRPPPQWRAASQPEGSARLAQLLDKLAESGPVIDLLVIDEAHYLRNPNTRSAEVGHLLREVSEHIVLLSATPINNREEDLYQLLRLTDPDSFDTRELFPQVLSANEPLLRARNLVLDRQSRGEDITNELRSAMRHPLLANSKQLRGLVERQFSPKFLSETANRVELANRIERINLLSHTINRTRKHEVQEWKVVREAHSLFVPLCSDGPEWEFYQRVTGSIREYALQNDISDGFLLSPPQRQMSSCMYAAAKSWLDRTTTRDIATLVYEDLGGSEFGVDGVGPLIEHIAQEVLPGFDIERLRIDDSKFDSFQREIRGYLSNNPGEKIIIFSYFKATLHYLEQRFSNLKMPVQLLHGGIAENKQGIIDRFRKSTDIRILLASEVASEGVDLQFCSLIVNYDLPWNPMKIEQRIGRIDRIGQKSNKVLIWNLGYKSTIDERIYTILLSKLRIFEHSLGGMEVVLGDLISELTSDLMSQHLTPEQEQERIEKTRIAVETKRRQQEELESNAAHLIAHGGYILEQIKASHDLKRQITRSDLKAYVKDYLDRYATGFLFKEKDKDPWVTDIRLPPELAAQFGEFLRESHLQGKSRLATGDTIHCQFANKIERFTRHSEIISQFHPLVRFISEELRKRSEKFYFPIAATIPRHAAPYLKGGMYAFVVKRWSFTGLRTEEMLRARAQRLDGQGEFLDLTESWNLVNAAKVEGIDWLSVSNDVEIKAIETSLDNCDIRLQKDYENAKHNRDNENTDRVTFQIQSAKRHRDRLLNSYNDLLTRYQMENKQGPIQMTKGRIEAIKRKFDVRLEQLQQRNKLTAAISDVCYGLARVSD